MHSLQTIVARNALVEPKQEPVTIKKRTPIEGDWIELLPTPIPRFIQEVHGDITVGKPYQLVSDSDGDMYFIDDKNERNYMAAYPNGIATFGTDYILKEQRNEPEKG